MVFKVFSICGDGSSLIPVIGDFVFSLIYLFIFDQSNYSVVTFFS